MAVRGSSEGAWLDATAQAARVRSGEVTPAELVEDAIGRIEASNKRLNAVITPLYAKAREEAAAFDRRGAPFAGVPFLIKDVVCHTAGDPFHCGMRFLRDRGWREAEDTWLVRRFRQAGFIIVGKTNTPELAFSPTTEPLAYGPTHNPWDPSRSPSGSSGGAASAVAAGMVAVAHGNDMGGSIRTPASACGLVGLKPTRARTSLGPELGEFWWQLTHEHVLTRSVRDSAGVLDAIRGPGPGDPYTAPAPAHSFASGLEDPPRGLRVGLYAGGPAAPGRLDPECREAVSAAARQLEGLGHHVELAAPAVLDEPGAFVGTLTVMGVAIARELDRWSERTGSAIRPGDVEPTTWFAAELGRRTSAPEYVAATEGLHRSARKLAGWWTQGFDLLLLPTLAQPPPKLGPLGPGGGEPAEVLRRWGAFAPFTIPFNVSGQPAISLPLHQTPEGLPVGVQLVAAYGEEALLLRVARQLEQACPWSDRHPPEHG